VSRLLIMLLVSCLSLPIYAQTKESVAVMPLKGAELPKSAVDALDELLVVSMASLGPYKVITPQDISAMLGREQLKDQLGCDDVACAAEIGGALGARYLLSGTARKLGSKLYMTLSLIDSQRQEVVKRSKAKVKNDEDLYEQAIETSVRDLFGLQGAAVAQPVATPSQPTAPSQSQPNEVQQSGTNLYWLRCPVGETWNGSSCDGKAKIFRWDDAQKACPQGYRVPTRAEYATLLGGCDAFVTAGEIGFCNNCSKSSPCSSMFGEDTHGYWTSSSYAGGAASALRVSFDSGFADNAPKTLAVVVRCVRGGP